jgi:hypothetical protein
MGNKTTAADVALGTFLSVFIVWQLNYWLPDMMATAPQLFGEALTGALIILLAYILPEGSTGRAVSKATGTRQGGHITWGGVKMMAAMCAAFLVLALLAGCPVTRPGGAVDECSGYTTTVQRSYCYASKEVTAARRATTQSLKDGAISKSTATAIAAKLSEADTILDGVELLILAGDTEQAGGQLQTVRSILLELK